MEAGRTGRLSRAGGDGPGVQDLDVEVGDLMLLDGGCFPLEQAAITGRPGARIAVHVGRTAEA